MDDYCAPGCGFLAITDDEVVGEKVSRGIALGRIDQRSLNAHGQIVGALGRKAHVGRCDQKRDGSRKNGNDLESCSAPSRIPARLRMHGELPTGASSEGIH